MTESVEFAFALSDLIAHYKTICCHLSRTPQGSGFVYTQKRKDDVEVVENALTRLKSSLVNARKRKAGPIEG